MATCSHCMNHLNEIWNEAQLGSSKGLKAVIGLGLWDQDRHLVP